jgi:polyribonucleotide nucleotidyltransferase
MEYEREQGNTASMEISTKSVARIVGKGGAQADKIKEESGLQSLDIDKLDNAEGTSRVTLKGSKAAISAAKKLINTIVQTVDDECLAEVNIPKAYHQELIRRGGARCKYTYQSTEYVSNSEPLFFLHFHST